MIQSQHDIDALIIQASQGDRPALETLLLHFYGPLLQFIRATSLEASSAGITPEDVLQVCMTEAFRSIHNVKPQGRDAFIGWLKVIAKTRFINMLEAHYAQKRGGGRIDGAHFAQTTEIGRAHV